MKQVSMNIPTSILLAKIRPCATQPRLHFDKDELRQLAESIKEVGQQEPIKVKSLGSHFEIIDGERRYRAAQVLGRKTIDAVVWEISSDQEQYIRSVALNFAREPHTPIETAKMLMRLIHDFQNGPEKLSRGVALKRATAICGKGDRWGSYYLRLLRLKPEIQAKCHEGSLPVEIGTLLSSFKPEKQVSILAELNKKKLASNSAVAFVRSRRNKSNMISQSRPRYASRKASDLSASLKSALLWIDRYASMKPRELEDIFLAMVSDRQMLMRDLTDAIEDLQAIKLTFEQFHKLNGPRPAPLPIAAPGK